MQAAKTFWSVTIFIYHIIFVVVYYFFVSIHGGDAQAYWELSIINYRPAEAWMDYFEYGNFFMQWLNYVPSKVLGIPYFVGNLFYGLLGGLGFVMLFRLGLRHWGWDKASPLLNSWVLLLFLPNLHFWTAGVGKETLLWIGMIGCFWGLCLFSRYGYLWALGIFISFMVRPINGLLLLIISFVWILFTIRELKHKLALGAVFLGLGLIAVKTLLRQTHIPFPSPENLSAFFASQQEFLQGFNAGSYIPMQGLSFPERLFAVMFRPLMWEVSGFWQWAAAIENTFFLLLMATALLFWLRRPFWPPFPPFLIAGMVLGWVFICIYAFSLNNLGIFMRMKSIFALFFYWGAWQILKEKVLLNRLNDSFRLGNNS